MNPIMSFFASRATRHAGPYTVTRVTSHRGHEGEPCLQGWLCRDGKRIVEFGEDEHGGEMRLFWADRDQPRVEATGIDYLGEPLKYKCSPEEAALLAHCASIPAVDSEHFSGKKEHVTIDLFICDLANDEREYAAMRRACSKKTCFRLKTDGVGLYRTVTGPLGEKAHAWLRQKYGDQLDVIFNEMLVQQAAAG
jgi:hypothetical protein